MKLFMRSGATSAAAGLLLMLPAGCKGGGSPLGQDVASGSFTPNALIFDSLPEGDQEVLTVQLEDTSIVDLKVSDPGTLGGDFKLLTAAPSVVAGMQSVPLQIQFRPTATGLRTGTLTLDTPGAATPQITLALSGSGIADDQVRLNVSPAALNFGTLLLGEASTEVLQIFNPNTFDTGVLLALSQDASSPQYALSVAGGSSGPAADGGGSGSGGSGADGGIEQVIKAQSGLNVNVTFAPSLPQVITGSISVAACPTCAPTLVPLTGTGIDAHLVFNPPHLDFGFVLDAVYPPPVLPVVASNSGDLPLTLLSVTASPNSPFSLVSPPNPGYLLQPDAGVPFSVSYSPSKALSDRDQIVATWTVTPPGAAKPLQRMTYLPAYGNQGLGACQLALSPAAGLDFGTLEPGASLIESLQVENLGGADCTVTVQLDPTSSRAFTLNPPPAGGLSDAGWVVFAHGVTEFGVTFATAPDTHHYSFNGAVQVVAPGGALLAAQLKAGLASGYGSAWPKWGHDNGNSGQGDYDTSATQGTLLWRVPLPTVPQDTFGQTVFDAGLGVFSVPNPGFGGSVRSNELGDPIQLFPYVPSVGGLTAGPVLDAKGEAVQTATPWQQSLSVLNPVDGGLTFWYPFGGSRGSGPQAPPSFTTSMSNPIVAQNGLIEVSLPNSEGPGVEDAYYLSLQTGQLAYFYAPQGSPAFSPGAAAPPLFLPGLINFLLPITGSGDTGTCWVSLPLQTTQPEVASPCFAAEVPTYGAFSGAVDSQANSYWCGQGSAAGVAPWNVQNVGNGCAQVVGAQSRRGWYQSFDPALVGAPVLGFGQLYVATFQEAPLPRQGRQAELQYQGTVYALDPASGGILWQYQLPGLPVLPMGRPPDPDAGIAGLQFHPDHFAGQELNLALGDDGALVVGYVDGVYCLEAAGPNQGNLRWKVPVAEGTLGVASIGLDGTSYIGTIAQGLLAIDDATGAVRWSYLPPLANPPAVDQYGLPVRSITARPAIGNQIIYFVADDNTLYAIH